MDGPLQWGQTTLKAVATQPIVLPDEPTPAKPESPATDAPAGFQPDWGKIIGWVVLLGGIGAGFFFLLT